MSWDLKSFKLIHMIILLVCGLIFYNFMSSAFSLRFYKFFDSKRVVFRSHAISTSIGTSNPSVIICGPSGVGKGSIISKILEKYPNNISLSVSHTTRNPRPGEVNGFHYHFISKEDMLLKLNQTNFFLENAQVHGNYYGTSMEAVRHCHMNRKICLLDVDVNGVKQIKSSNLLLNALYIFIAPPSIDILRQRLLGRGTESIDQLNIRLGNAAREIEYGETPGNFDHVVVNEFLENSTKDVYTLIHKKFPDFF